MKKILIFIAVFIIVMLMSPVIYASDNSDQIYSDAENYSKADSIADALPENAKNELEKLNIKKPSWKELNSLSFGEIFMSVLSIAEGQSKQPLTVSAAVLAVVLFSALLDNFKQPLMLSSLEITTDTVTAILISIILIYPIVDTISRAGTIITAASGFVLAYVPVLTGIIISCGQASTGSSYYYLMLAVGQFISRTAQNILIPFLNAFLGLSVICSVSSAVRLNGLCAALGRLIKWVLTFSMLIFTAVLTFQTILSSASDSTGLRAARFAISSFVPIVGGALSDAFSTVQGCVKMLKSGVGIFAVLGSAFIFLPIVAECIFWSFTINISLIGAEVFGLSQPAKLLKSVCTVVNTVLAILLCVMTAFVLSTAIVLMAGA